MSGARVVPGAPPARLAVDGGGTAGPNGAEMTGSRHERMARVSLYLIATAPPEPEPSPAWLAGVRAAVEGGVGAVQLRQKGVATELRRHWLSRLRETLGDDVLLLVNDDLAAVLSPAGAPLADGLHLGRTDAESLATEGSREQRRSAGLARARETLGSELLLGTSTRNEEEIALALDAGSDHVGFGAMAPSLTKPAAAVARPAELARCLELFPALPLFAIGGIDIRSLPRWLALGCRRVALAGAVLDAPDPRTAAAALAELLSGAR